jgi:hypothetical protein
MRVTAVSFHRLLLADLCFLLGAVSLALLEALQGAHGSSKAAIRVGSLGNSGEGSKCIEAIRAWQRE